LRPTGRSLTDCIATACPAVAAGTFSALFLEPDRNVLYERIDARFDAMLEAGAWRKWQRWRRDTSIPSCRR